MKKIILLFFTAVFVFSFSLGNSAEKIIVLPDPTGIKVEISTNRGQDSDYFPGEDLAIYFKVYKNSFVAIYDILSNGKVSLIFPNRYDQNNFVLAGQLYTIPRAGYRFMIGDITGKEYFQIFASAAQFTSSDSWQRAYKNSVFPTESLNAETFFSQYVENIFLVPQISKLDWGCAITGVNILPRPLTGLADFSSFPSGAQVNVDGSFSGKTTPCTLELSVGVHWVEFFIPGGKANGQNINISAGKTISVFQDLFK